jgi:uncharacterized protein YecT (DUF1311 family)
MSDLGVDAAQPFVSELATRRRVLPVLACLAALAGPSMASAAEPPATRPIEFARGASSAKLHGGIARGEVAYYHFGAAEGQWAEVAVGSVEDNAVVTVFAPGWKIVQAEGAWMVEGETMPSMSFGEEGVEEDGSQRWSAILYEGGKYLVVVGSLRGGAEYDLELAIRAPTDEDCGNLPQQPMNFCTGAIVEGLERDRGKLERQLAEALDADRGRQRATAEAAWKAYRDAQCELEASGFEGGSLQPTIRNSCVAGMTRARIEALRQLLEIETGG